MEQSGCLGSTPSLSNQPMDHDLKGWDTRIFSLFINTPVHSPVRINCSSVHQLCCVGEKWEVSSIQHCFLAQECFMSLLGVGAHKTEALHFTLALCLVQTNQVKGVEGSKCIYWNGNFCSVHPWGHCPGFQCELRAPCFSFIWAVFGLP